MKLNLDTLPAGRSDLDVDAVYALDPDDPIAGSIVTHGVLTVDNTEAMVLVGGTLEADSPAECDRCLETFTFAYEAEVDIQIVRTNRGEPEEDPDTWILHQARGVIDLQQPLRESVILALPIKRVCDETCKGICAHCGANRNQDVCDCDQEQTDPRWDALPS